VNRRDDRETGVLQGALQQLAPSAGSTNRGVLEIGVTEERTFGTLALGSLATIAELIHEAVRCATHQTALRTARNLRGVLLRELQHWVRNNP
jgi:hypothetical protein